MLAQTPLPIIPLDTSQDPNFRWEPYATVGKRLQSETLIQAIAVDICRYNRLTPSARDYVLAYAQAQMLTASADQNIRNMLLAFLSFYPEHVGLLIALSCCYEGMGHYSVQAHLSRVAIDLSITQGSVSSEALTNLAVSYIHMVRISFFRN